MKKRAFAAIAAVVGLGMVMPATVSAYSVDELQVNIWDNNQLAGLQQIADEWS